MKGRSKIVWVALLALVGLGIASYFSLPELVMSQGTSAPPAAGSGGSAGGAGGPPRAMPVQAVTVRVGTVTDAITAIGSLLANESVVIRPEIAGRITDIHFSEGQKVAKGAKLVSLDATELRAQLAESASAVKLNSLNFQRSKELSQKKLLSRQDHDQAQANLNEAQARQNINEARIDKTRLDAPFDGVLGLRQVSPGDFVQPGEDIVNLEDISSLKVDFRVPETYVAKISEKQRVELAVDAFPDKVFTGEVYAIDPRIDEVTRTLQLRARIPNDTSELRPGMFARVSVTLEERANALLIPEQALVPAGQERFVYLVREGKAVKQTVVIGQRRAGEVEILEGIKAGDVVVTDGQMKIGDGAPVAVMPVADRPS